MLRFILLILAISPLQGLPYRESPAAPIDPLIAATTKLLEKQKQLKSLLEKYGELHTRYLKNIDDRALAMQIGKTAQEALEIIKEEKLNYLFDPSAISEMTLFAKLAAKPSIPKLP